MKVLGAIFKDVCFEELTLWVSIWRPLKYLHFVLIVKNET
jgi:hypothetical protein